MANLKLALRTLFKTPFVTAVAVLSLALGIGANVGIFSLFEQMILRPLPVAKPEQLVSFASPGPKPGSTSCNQAGDCDAVFSYPMFRDLEKAKGPFAGIAAHRGFGANVAYDKQTLNGQGMLVSGSYFPMLGIRPTIGRLFGPADDQVLGANFIAVLSHSYWQDKLGSDPDVLGKRIVVNGQTMTVVGVGPAGFEGTTLGTKPMIFVPLSMRGAMEQWASSRMENRRNYWAYVFGRLKPGVSIDQAKSAINAIYKPIINDVEAPLQEGMSEKGMKAFRDKQIVLTDGRRGQSSVHKEARTPLLLLFAVTATVLLIACANIANLLLARGAGRTLEMAVRLSLGASRRQLITQLLTESVLLAALGGVVSIIVAKWTLGAISALLPGEVTATMRFELKPVAVAFAAALSIGTGILFGLFPALQSTRPDLATALRDGTGKHSGARAASRFRTSLVVVQIALSMALLVPAGLFIKSLMNVSRVDLGLKADHVVTFGISPELNGYDNARSAALFQRVEEELGALPGVTGVTAARVPVLAGNNWGNDVHVEGYKESPDDDMNARFNEVGPGYFRTMGIEVLAGREFTAGDNATSPKVVLVNEAFARKFKMGRDVVGKRMGRGGMEKELDLQIVGLVRDSKYSDVKDKVPPLFFFPYRADTAIGSMYFYVRTAGEPETVIRSVAGVVRRLDANLPVEDLKTLPQQIRENVFMDRMISTLSAAFAILATLLAAVGLYGVLAYTVVQRTKEIGVRMALGADASRVRRMVLRQVALMAAVGGVIGVGAAYALGRAAQSLLYEMQGHDPVVFAVAAVVLGAVAMIAGYLPALRASKVDPMQALRYE